MTDKQMFLLCVRWTPRTYGIVWTYYGGAAYTYGIILIFYGGAACIYGTVLIFYGGAASIE